MRVRDHTGTTPGPGALSRTAADRLAALAAQAAGAPTGMVQLLDDDLLRLHGGFGLPAGWETIREIPVRSALAARIFDTGEPVVVEDLIRDPDLPADAPAHDVAAQAYAGFPVRDPDGGIVGICCVLDYAPHRWSPAALTAVEHAAQACGAFVAEKLARREAERHRLFLDAVVNSLHDGVLARDVSGRTVVANAAMRAVDPGVGQAGPGGDGTGPGRDGAGEVRLCRPDGSPLTPVEMPLARALRGEPVKGADLLVHTAGVRPRLLVADARPIDDATGHRLGAVLTVHDATERRRAERFRACELAVTTALAEAASVERAGPRVLEAVATTLGWSHAELWLVDDGSAVLRPAAQWSVPDRSCALRVPDQLGCGTGLAGQAWQRAEPLWISDIDRPHSPISGSEAKASQLHAALAIPVRSGRTALGVLTFFADVVEDPEEGLITLLSGIAAHVGQFIERRRAEELQLQLARSKDEYLALVGHELRTPLTSIAAYAALLREADPQAFATDGPALVEIIDRNAANLRRIVDDLLELAALDAGHAGVEITDCDLTRVVNEAVDAIRPGLAAVPLALTVEAPGELVVAGDPDRLRQVVDNLLGNAIKYTPEGGSIAVSLRGIGGHAAELTVADTGIGIPPDERKRLFTRFYRSSRSRNRAIPGTGLGLAISRAIVERHRGSIALQPGDEPGTRIVVRLPRAAR